MNLKQKVLMTMGTVAVAALIAGGGSFASFTAQTTNPGNTFATGTLVMSNTVNAGTACLSTGGGSISTNANANCDTLFNLTVKKPGDSATADLKIKNEGSVDASALKAFATGCTDGDAAGQAYHGTGTPCSVVQVYVQQWDDAAHTTATACLYGGAAVTNTCDFSNTAKTLGDYASNYTNSSNGLSIGSGLTAGTTDYFTIGVKLPSSADNTFQGRQASIGFTWFMQ
jgi:predicted ribosomally synthesized peptide with SipW-like signal peptide